MFKIQLEKVNLMDSDIPAKVLRSFPVCHAVSARAIKAKF
jgi:hypothetical protein